MLSLTSFYFLLWHLYHVASAVNLNKNDHALVTLVTGDGGYANGALALGSSYLSSNGKMSLVALVTPDVPDEQVRQLSTMWQVIEVEPVACNHKLGSKVTAATHDLNGAAYKAGIARWKHTCTKFRTWELVQFKRVVFMDSDMLVISSIDHALYEYSNASFVAAPETFPPDTFNAGFIVLTPSKNMFKKLLRINQRIGSAEGGDQGVLNNGLCPHWFAADSDDPDCGRLPWIFNVEVVHYKQYETLQKMAGRPPPAVIHFVSDGKPWTVLAMDYVEDTPAALNDIKDKLLPLTYAHALWRVHFFKATGYTPPLKSVFGDEMDALFAADKRNKENSIPPPPKLHDKNAKEKRGTSTIMSDSSLNFGSDTKDLQGETDSVEEDMVDARSSIRSDNRAGFTAGKRGKRRRPMGKVRGKRKKASVSEEEL